MYIIPYLDLCIRILIYLRLQERYKAAYPHSRVLFIEPTGKKIYYDLLEALQRVHGSTLAINNLKTKTKSILDCR